MAGRDLHELLRVIGAERMGRLLMPSDPLILQAFQGKDITSAEAQTLLGFANADPKSQRRRLSAKRRVGSAEIEKMKANIAGVRAKLERRYPPRDSDVL